jgi:hypothetical protein
MSLLLGGVVVSQRLCMEASIGYNHYRGKVAERALDRFAGRGKTNTSNPYVL